MQTYTATSARSQLFQMLADTAKTHLPKKISSKQGDAILLSELEYESLVETAYLMSVPGFQKSIEKADKDIKSGDVYTLDEVFS